MRQAHLNGDFTLLRLPKPVDQFQQYTRQPRPGIPVSQPHDRPLATLYPLSIDDKECEGALGITPHVLSQGDLVYYGDPRPDDSLGRVAVSAACPQVRHTEDVALLKQRHDGFLVSPVALVKLDHTFGDKIEVLSRLPTNIDRLLGLKAALCY